ncbi:tigger transposable element-derived protein 1-like [Syngnathoides biaculeatus]|uniref:tigger transposable element-derived protein 1-like n=1 Tax=Syngnathoides biaculeatus TaxID=300417 RepID=UPI002ADE054E|nr:tigger transposable element-derived protein 1-like [Syngnathoides biaculeatus]
MSFEDNQRRQKLMEAVGETPVLYGQDIQQLIGCQEELPPQQPPPIKEEEEDPQSPHKEEEGQLPPRIKVEVVEADVCDFLPIGVSVKSENDDENPTPQHHHSHRAQWMTARPDEDHPAGPPPDNLLAPLSDSDDMEVTSDSDPDWSKKGSNQHSQMPCRRRKPKRFRCSVCGQRFLREQHLTRHMRKHTGEILRCSACFKGFLHKHALTKHMKIHTGEKTASCSVWNKGFIQKSNTQTPQSTNDEPAQNQILLDNPCVGSPSMLDLANSQSVDAEYGAVTSLARLESLLSASDNLVNLPLSTAPKQLKTVSDGIRRPIRLTVEQKKEIIAEHETGIRVSDLAVQFGIAKSTICTILKNKASIKAADVAKGVMLLTKQRTQILEEVEKLLLLWVNEKELAGGGVNAAAVCHKAKMLHRDLLANTQTPNGVVCETFKASRGWFDNFVKRSGIRSIKHVEDVASLNEKDAEEFVGQFERFVKSGGYLPSQVFNCGEAAFFWRKMPKRTSLTKEEKARPGHKPMKDKLTLLLCANASGDCQMKPLLVYHSENPRAFKSNHVIKAKLPVVWRSNPKIRVTRIFFVEWVAKVFAPAVKMYLQENGLPLKCLLVMDKASAHPPALEEDLDIEYDFIKVKFLPSNTTLLLQPMGQPLISNFKKLYTRALFLRCFEVTQGTDLPLNVFWRDQFNIFHCINMIDEVWREVSYRTLQSAWKKLWPACVAEGEFEDLANEEAAVVDEIVSIGKSMGLEVDRQDVEELVEEQVADHHKDLTTADLLELQSEQVKSSEAGVFIRR